MISYFLQILVVLDPRRDLRLGPLHLTSHRVVVENLAGVCSARGRLGLVPSARSVVGRIPRHLTSGQGRERIVDFLERRINKGQISVRALNP